MIRLRRAATTDIDALTQMRLDYLRDMGAAGAEHQAPALMGATRAYFARALLTDAFVAFVAEHEGQIVATSGLVIFERPPYGGRLPVRVTYVLNMYVLPDWRGQGIASALLAELIAFARGTGVNCLRLHATADGRNLYERHGFVARADEIELRL